MALLDILHDVALPQEVELHLISCLTMVQPNLNAACALARSFQVVEVDNCINDMLTTRDLLQIADLGALGQP